MKHTQRIRRQKPTDFLSLLDHFVGLVLKGLGPFLSSSVTGMGIAVCSGRIFMQNVPS